MHTNRNESSGKHVLTQILTPQSKNLALHKRMSITGLMRRLSLKGINAMWQLNLGCLLIRTISKLATLYWLPKLHKRPYKSCFIASSSSCTSILLTSCLTAIKNHVIQYCTAVYEKNGKNLF